MKLYQLRIVIVLAGAWMLLSPLAAARMLSWRIGCSFTDVLPHYSLDLLAAAAALAPLVASWRINRWAGAGLLVVAFVLLLQKVTFGFPEVGAWTLSLVLLVIAGWGSFVAVDSGPPTVQTVALRGLLIPSYVMAAIGAPAAYLNLVASVVGGVEGIAEGHYVLGVLLSTFALLGMVALWRVWSIGRRVWRDGAYRSGHVRELAEDRRGVLLGWIALIGFGVAAPVLHRVGEVIILSVLLAPALLFATVAVSLRAPEAPSVDEASMQSAPFTHTKLRTTDLLGVLCGAAVALLGVIYVAPRPMSGWGACDWWTLYPLMSSLWPTERPVIFDACNTSILYVGFLGAVCAAVSLVAGAVAGAIGRDASSLRGAAATGSVAIYALVTMIASVWSYPDWSEIRWFSTLVLGASIIAAAAWLGYLGGCFGAVVRKSFASHPVPQ